MIFNQLQFDSFYFPDDTDYPAGLVFPTKIIFLFPLGEQFVFGVATLCIIYDQY